MSIESRSRMISFRLTAEEYDQVREACLAQGIRSISEMARAAIYIVLQQPVRPPENSVESRLTQIEGRLRLLSLEIEQLTGNACLKVQHD